MRKLTAREVFLLVAVSALAILGWVYGRGGGIGASGAKAEELKALQYGDPPIVQLAKLELEPVTYDSEDRNLFDYYTPPPPPRPKPTPPPPRKPTTQVQRPPQQTVQRPPTPVVRAEPKAPRPTFRYIGFLGPKDNKIAVLEHGDEILLAGIGETLQSQYKVVDFKYETLVIGYTAEKWADQTTELPMKR